ncbi:MAG: PKD domain-containing protein, partial [Candidatus Hydrogenedentes bacterium]|nr:PKD domain-containing protein [Candidatus Hydrogenedentota bacterium]
TAPNSGFSLAYSGMAAQGTHDQFFTFAPVSATYVKLLLLDNYGGNFLELSEFSVFESGTERTDLLRNTGKVYQSFGSTASSTAALRVTDDENNQTTALANYAVAERHGSLATVWVSQENHVAAYDVRGQLMKRISGFDSPRDLVVDEARGKLWVVDSDTDRLFRFDTSVPDGYNVNTSFFSHDVFGGMDNPYSLALDSSDGSVWVNVRNSDTVVRVPGDLLNGAPISVTATSPADGPTGVQAHMVGVTSSALAELGNGVQIGDGGFVLLPHDVFDGLGDFTFEAWFSHSFSHDGTVLSVASANDANMLLIFLDTTTSISVNIHGQNYAFTVPDMSGSRHHVALARSGADVTLILDGSAIETASMTDLPLIVHPGGALLGQEQDQLQGGFASTQQLDGVVDDVRVWNVARSEAQVVGAKDAELAGNETDLLAYWTLNTQDNTAPVFQYGGFVNVNDIALDQTRGRLWVADETGNAVIGLDTNAANGYNIATDSGFHVAVGGFAGLKTVVVDPGTGAVWVGSNDLYKLDSAIADGYDVSTDTGSHEMIPFDWDPLYLGRSPVNGMLWIGESSLTAVSRLEFPGGEERSRTLLSTDEPHHFGAHPQDGSVWAVDFEDYQLYHFAPAGNLIKSISTGASGDLRPFAVGIDSGVSGLNAPQVSASASSSAKASEGYNFTATATDNGTIVRYDWDFEGDGIYDFTSPTSPDTSFTYTVPGSYVPVLRVIDNEGLAGYGVADPVGIGELEVFPSVTPATPVARTSVVFDGVVRGAELGIVEYAWDINGDGVIDRTQTDEALYSNDFDAPGVYTVTLQVTTSSGATASGSITVNVLQDVPEARATVDPGSGKSPLFVSLNDNSSRAASGGSIVLYEWDYDNDGTFDWYSETGGNAAHIYTVPGIHRPTLRVTDNLGQQDSDTVAVDVQRTGPTAMPAADAAEGNAPFMVNFDGSGSSATDGATLLSYQWNFGDGNTATGVSIGHEFTNARSQPYAVMLTVIDSNGDSDTVELPIQVKPTGSPTAVAGTDLSLGGLPLEVNLTAIGSSDPDGTIVLYEWDFDGDATYDYTS